MLPGRGRSGQDVDTANPGNRICARWAGYVSIKRHGVGCAGRDIGQTRSIAEEGASEPVVGVSQRGDASEGVGTGE